eukprot:6174864-Pleurochrysis_carterae.AAC.2
MKRRRLVHAVASVHTRVHTHDSAATAVATVAAATVAANDTNVAATDSCLLAQRHTLVTAVTYARSATVVLVGTVGTFGHLRHTAARFVPRLAHFVKRALELIELAPRRGEVQRRQRAL